MLSENSSPLFELPRKILLDVCRYAGSHDLIDGLRSSLSREGIIKAVRRRDSKALFEWLLRMATFQGISDYVALKYMEQHGTVSYNDVEQALAIAGTCPKLTAFSSYVDCRYEKSLHRCAFPSEIAQCPVPLLPLRNGRLNQTALSLFFFIRDVTGGDFVGWVDRTAVGEPETAASRLVADMAPVFGISDKVISMTLSGLLLACSRFRPRWGALGGQMIVVDTLVHNFLWRTGILRHLGAEHGYGPACYGNHGCASIIRSLSRQIDAREFNPTYPAHFPRFVQQAIWRLGAELELDTCNGTRIDDRHGCRQAYCGVFEQCARLQLKPAKIARNRPT